LVTFLLTDVEGSTGLWEHDEAGMDDALARHDDVMRSAIAAHGGHVFSTAGDSFAVVFATPMDAVDAAVDAQRALGRSTPWPGCHQRSNRCACCWARPTSPGVSLTVLR
jgi:class 3 adenylate cyclase